MKSASNQSRSFLLIEVSQQLLAIDMSVLDGVQSYQAATALPFTPEFFEGLVNVLGTPLAQVNMAKYLGFYEEPTESSVLINQQGSRFLISVNAIGHTLTIKEDECYVCTDDARFDFYFHHQDTKVYSLNMAVLVDQLKLRQSPVIPQAGEYVQLEAVSYEHTQLDDYCLLDIHGEFYAVNLMDAERFIEIQQTLPIKDAALGAWAYILINKNSYLLCDLASFYDDKAPDTDANLALLLSHSRYNLALSVNQLCAVEQFAADEVIATTESEKVLKWQDNVFQVVDIKLLWQLAEQKLQSLLVPKTLVPIVDPVRRVQFLIFAINKAAYAIAFEHVYRVEQVQCQVTISGHQHVQGVFAIEGQTVAIINPFQQQLSQVSEYLILKDAREQLFALAISELYGSISIDVDKIQLLSAEADPFLQGFFNYKQLLYTILNPTKFHHT